MLGGTWSSNNVNRDGRSTKTAIEIDSSSPPASSSESTAAPISAKSPSVAVAKKQSGSSSDADSFVPPKGKLSLRRRRKSRKRRADPKSEASSDESPTENEARDRGDEPGPRRKKKDPKFWFVEGDRLEVEPTRRFKLIVRGNPLPKQRHRSAASGFFFNPSRKDENEFKSVVEAVCKERIGCVPNFGSEANLKLTVQFRFPSPKTEKGAIRKKADLDNLCKFLLDSLNGVLYIDDGQFVKLIADKAFDDSIDGSGFTTFEMEVVDI